MDNGSYPVAGVGGTGGGADEGSPSIWDDFPVLDDEIMNNYVLSNNGQLDTNGLSPDNGVTSQLNVNQPVDDSEENCVGLRFIGPLTNGNNLENTHKFSDAPEIDVTMESAIVDRIQNDNVAKNQLHCRCGKCGCLKKYCDCFRSGFYCLDSCTCLNCYNTRDYEDSVEEARERMLAQDPSAFISKLEIHDKLNGITPVRHTKGCTCKKSKCEKRYCECYQAEVGCHELCRCEGCKNPYNKNSDDSNKMCNSNTKSSYGSQQPVS